MVTDRISVEQTETLYSLLPEWADHTGPFGGAYAWALENLKPNTELIGAYSAMNSHGRTEIYKYRLIMGPDQDVRGRLEMEGGQVCVIRNGYMGLTQGQGQEWVKRWVIVEQPDGKLVWELEWERIISYREPGFFAPLTAVAVLTNCSEQIGSYARNHVRRNWCKEVLGVNHTNLDQCHRYRDLVRGRATERHRSLYRYVHNKLQEVLARKADASSGRRGEMFTNEDMNDLVTQAKLLLAITH